MDGYEQGTEQARKLLQGWISGTISKAIERGTMPLNVVSVEVPKDAMGNYEDYIEVTLRSGTKVHVLFTSFMPELPF